MLLFSATLCLAATLIFGLLPAWGPARRSAGADLRHRGGGHDRAHVLMRNGLVASQLALALVLLVGTSLLLRSFARLYAVDLGIRTEGVVTARLPLVDTRFPSTGERTRHYESRVALFRRRTGAALPWRWSIARSRRRSGPGRAPWENESRMSGARTLSRR